MPDKIVTLKVKDAYPTITKIIDGKSVDFVDIDALSEEQFKKFCRDTGTEWFQRFNVTI